MHNRLAHLDGLRGLAAILVLCQHLLEYLVRPSNAWAWVVDALTFFNSEFNLGKVGVVAFFLISGFIVPYSYSPPLAVGRFVTSRFFRLYPAFWVSIALALILRDREFTSAQVLANMTMIPKLLGYKEVMVVYWTLFVEMAFYVTTVFVFVFGRLRSLRWCCALVILFGGLSVVGAFLRSAGHGFAPVTLLLYLTYMWFGACCRLLFIEQMQGAKMAVVVMLLAVLLLTPLVWGIAFDDHSHSESVRASVMGCFGGIGLFFWCVARKSLTHRIWLHAGSLSYSVYLFHLIALDVGFAFGTRIAGEVYAIHLLTQVAVTLVFTWVLAALVKRWVEDPAIEVGRQVGDRLWGKKAAGLSAAGGVKS